MPKDEKKKTPQFEETEQISETVVKRMLELLDQEFETIVINTLRVLMIK